MSRGISRRIAAVCSLVVVSGFACSGSAHAAAPAPAAPKTHVTVRLAPDAAPTVKLGQAILEEYTVSSGGIAVVHESVPGAAQQAQASPVKTAAVAPVRKA